MTTVNRLHVDELSMELINSIKEAFKGKSIEIIVSEAQQDETDYLLSSDANRKSLKKSLEEAERNEFSTFTVEELQAKYGKK